MEMVLHSEYQHIEEYPVNSITSPNWLPTAIEYDPGPPRNFAPKDAQTYAVVLGSGGVNATPHRNGPSGAVIVNESTYIIDAGEGIWRGIAWAAISHKGLLAEHFDPRRINRLFLTHLHSDHTIGLPAVWLKSWIFGRQEPFKVYGPIGTRKLTEHLIEAYHGDLNERKYGPEGNQEKLSGWQIEAHEIEKSGLIYEDRNVKIEAYHHLHGNFKQNFAYRFSTPDRVIAWAGDGRVEGELEEAAKDADILFSELSTEDNLINANWGGDTLREKQKTIWSYHITPKELAEFATRMNVKTLVTMHERNYSDPFMPDALMNEFKRDYEGVVYSSRDGDVF